MKAVVFLLLLCSLLPSPCFGQNKFEDTEDIEGLLLEAIDEATPAEPPRESPIDRLRSNRAHVVGVMTRENLSLSALFAKKFVNDLSLSSSQREKILELSFRQPVDMIRDLKSTPEEFYTQLDEREFEKQLKPLKNMMLADDRQQKAELKSILGETKYAEFQRFHFEAKFERDPTAALLVYDIRPTEEELKRIRKAGDSVDSRKEYRRLLLREMQSIYGKRLKQNAKNVETLRDVPHQPNALDRIKFFGGRHHRLEQKN